MIGDGSLTFREFIEKEPYPLCVLHDAVLEFLHDRDDAVILGSYAVNAYGDQPRMGEDVDVASTRGAALAEAIRMHLSERFPISLQVLESRNPTAYRVRRERPQGVRPLVHIHPRRSLPPARHVDGFLVVTPEELVAGKLRAFVSRRNRPKAGIDRRDLALLLLRFPELKTSAGPVRDRLLASAADETVLEAWDELVAQEIRPEEDEDEFGG